MTSFYRVFAGHKMVWGQSSDLVIQSRDTVTTRWAVAFIIELTGEKKVLRQNLV